jgi:hypothetical protein
MQEYVNFQGHTVFHPCLPSCTDDESRFEIEQSKMGLEQEFGLKVNALAFPNGEYTARDIELIQKAGYTCALSTNPGFNTGKTDLFKLNRFAIGDKDSLEVLAIKSSGIWGFTRKFLINLRLLKR